MSRILTNEYTYIYCSTRRSKAPAIARPKGARALQLYLYSPPLRPFSTSHTKSTEFTQKCLKIDHFFLQKTQKSKSTKKYCNFSKIDRNENPFFFDQSKSVFFRGIQIKSLFSNSNISNISRIPTEHTDVTNVITIAAMWVLVSRRNRRNEREVYPTQTRYGV